MITKNERTTCIIIDCQDDYDGLLYTVCECDDDGEQTTKKHYEFYDHDWAIDYARQWSDIIGVELVENR